MKVIREFGTDRCDAEIDFTKPVRFWERVSLLGGSMLSIPIVEKYGMTEVYFWDTENVTAIIGDDKYELSADNPKVFAQLKNNVELLFALKALK